MLARDLDLGHEDLGAYAFFPNIGVLKAITTLPLAYEDYRDVFSKEKADELLELGWRVHAIKTRD